MSHDTIAENPFYGKNPFRYYLAAWGIAAVVLLLVLRFHLLAALFSGLTVYELVQRLSPRLRDRVGKSRARLTAVALLSALIVALLTLLIFLGISFFRTGAESLPRLAQMMAEVLDGFRDLLPAGLISHLPADVDQLNRGLADWLRRHAADLQLAGGAVLRTLAHMLIGMVIGALVALRVATPHRLRRRPLATALSERVRRFSRSFRNIVFAQVRISALNAFLTWLYLGVALPLCGITLPYTKTLIAVTFVAGLLPVLGNLVSNSVIVVVSLGISLQIALISLTFLVVIHKLEYFVNAKIIGTRINAGAWELLVAMLVLESMFGLRGLIAAPVYYAYLKDELRGQRLI